MEINGEQVLYMVYSFIDVDSHRRSYFYDCEDGETVEVIEEWQPTHSFVTSFVQNTHKQCDNSVI